MAKSQRQGGRRQECMCVNERVGGESQEVVVMSFNSIENGFYSFTREQQRRERERESWMGKPGRQQRGKNFLIRKIG